MRVFILERTPLARVASLTPSPRTGDVVAWLRAGQDADGAGAAALAAAGISIIAAESLLNAETSRQIDDLGANYLQSWFHDRGGEVGRIGDLSLGKSFGLDLARHANPRYLVRTGEIVRRIIATYPAAEEFVTDLTDGDGMLRTVPAFLPLAGIAAHVAASLGRTMRFAEGVDPLPPSVIRSVRHSVAVMTRIYLGGLRPVWLLSRLHLRAHLRRATRRPAIYIFGGRGLHLVAARLAAGGRFDVISSDLDIAGADSLRHDQLFVLPRLVDLRTAWHFLRHTQRIATRVEHSSALRFEGVSYGPVVAGAFAALLARELWLFIVVLAQSRKLQRMTNFAALIVNGAGNEPMGNLVALNQRTGRRIYLISHGLDVHKIAIFCPVVDNPHITHFVYGTDHGDDYRLYLPEPLRPRQIVLGIPVTTVMNNVRGERSREHRKRLLIFSFGQLDFWNAARIRACDRYYVETFRIAGDLVREGWTVSCRAHPGHSQALERRIAAALGLEHIIVWDRHDTLDDALLAHDVVVSNLSSAYYQSLYAGWPTIFYEPDYREMGSIAGIETDPMLTGLPVARDIERPVTNDPATLGRLIRETLDPASPTSTFPVAFAGALAHRFIGPRAADADVAIAEFIEHDFFATAAEPSAETQTTPLDTTTKHVMA